MKLTIKKKLTHLSASQISLYEQCPLCYYYQYLSGEDRERGFTPYFSIGSTFHLILDSLGQGKTLEDSLEIGREDFDKYKRRLSGSQRGEMSILIWNLKLYHEYEFLKNKQDIISTEEEVKVVVPNLPIPVVGYIDVVLRTGIRDYKTVGRKGFSPDKWQMYIYSLWYQQKYGKLPRTVEYVCFSKVNTGEKDGRSKGYWIERVKVNRENLLLQQAQILGVYQAIEKGVFYPKQAQSCKYSAFKEEHLRFAEDKLDFKFD